MELDFGCFIIKSALNSRSQETENQVFLLKSMGPANKNFVILSLVITNNKYVKTLSFTSVGLTEMLKQIEIKVSLCEKSGIHQPIRLREDGFTAKNLLNLQNLICCQCLKLRSNCPKLLINMIFNFSPITQEQRGYG